MGSYTVQSGYIIRKNHRDYKEGDTLFLTQRQAKKLGEKVKKKEEKRKEEAIHE